MDYEHQKMLTCIGNKRSLVKNIEEIVEKDILTKLKKDKINILDGFAGSSVVSRSLSKYASTIYSNDLELYSSTMAQCFLIKPSEKDKEIIYKHIDEMNKLANNGPFVEGIISEMYSPKDTENIKEDERCFYTRENALIIDTLRKYIEDKVPKKLFQYCITPLLIKASIHTNTGGVFKGFYKDKLTKKGKFGGTAENNLDRIKAKIKLEYPVWSDYPFKGYVYNQDINELIKELPKNLDLIYYDPPYNEHPYSSNYFMLNIILKNEKPETVSKISGIPKDWNRSNYNYEKKAIEAMTELIKESMNKTTYILLSYNNEGIISKEKWDGIFSNYKVEKYEITYGTYKASRNLKQRSNKVIEIMYLISKN